MKRKDFEKLTPIEKTVLMEHLASQPMKMGKPRSQQKGFSDLPLFDLSKNQQELF